MNSKFRGLVCLFKHYIMVIKLEQEGEDSKDLPTRRMLALEDVGAPEVKDEHENTIGQFN